MGLLSRPFCVNVFLNCAAARCKIRSLGTNGPKPRTRHESRMSLSTEQIVALRPALVRPQPSTIPVDVLHEVEAADRNGTLANVTTILLRGSECSFRCTMCDLWKTTHLGPTPVGNIPKQILEARKSAIDLINPSRLRWLKLYNASNFFAPYNVPTSDLPAIANLVKDFDRVIVENHPLLTSTKIADFAKLLNGRLEVAMGLETIEPTALRSLNKQMSVDDVRRATEQLIRMGVDARLFVLLRPPGLSESAAIEWCLASIDAARNWGARHVSVIPVRGGNGAMEQLQQKGEFEPPLTSSLEQVLSESVGKSTMVITADLWDWHRLRGLCPVCSQPRYDRMQRMNLTQSGIEGIQCACPGECESS